MLGLLRADLPACIPITPHRGTSPVNVEVSHGHGRRHAEAPVRSRRLQGGRGHRDRRAAGADRHSAIALEDSMPTYIALTYTAAVDWRQPEYADGLKEYVAFEQAHAAVL